MRPAHPVQRFVALLPLFSAFHPPSTALCGPIGSSTEGPNAPSACVPEAQFGTFTCPVQRFVAP
eukprot:1094631-Pyramimonas_sp.AAC.1